LAGVGGKLVQQAAVPGRDFPAVDPIEDLGGYGVVHA
jgi:hypothetical protein